MSQQVQLIHAIIEGATDPKATVSDVLRKCLVLSYKMKNDALKEWVTAELNGYADAKELPAYRKKNGISKGLLIGPFNTINDQPLSLSILEQKHRHIAGEINLTQPIAAYEDFSGKGDARLDWPPDMTLYYQAKIIPGYALNRAWVEIPASVIQGLLDTVRTRLLTFALEIQANLPGGNESAIEEIPAKTVDRIMQVTINGGNVVLGDVASFQTVTIQKGDLAALKDELAKLGIEADDVKQLERTLSEEGAPESKSLGRKTLNWIADAASKAASAGAKVGGKILEETIKAYIKGYLGG